MHIEENVDLANHSTMRLGGKARYLAEAVSEDDVANLAAWADEHKVPCLMIGGGSNIVWRDEGYPGLIIVNRLQGKEILEDNEAGVVIKVAAGENWDEFVAWTVEKGLSGIEFMSLVPGTVGAAPVQNVGAYGGELSNVLVEVQAFDTQDKSFGSILNEACEFAYRTSRFKTKDHGRFMITSIVVRLSKQPPLPPFYEALENYFTQKGIATGFTPAIIRDAVIEIRRSKLPDPAIVANNGSFFTNPIIEHDAYQDLLSRYPDIKSWPQTDGRIKLSAAWMVERAGFKDVHDPQTGMATWPNQALVLVNEHARSTADLLAFKQKIVSKVQELFGVTLQQEPELLP